MKRNKDEAAGHRVTADGVTRKERAVEGKEGRKGHKGEEVGENRKAVERTSKLTRQREQ